MPESIERNAINSDLSGRVFQSSTVVASPALAAETIIAQVNTPGAPSLVSGLLVSGWAAFTVGTSGTAVRLRVRRTNLSGTLVADTGALTGGVTAANLLAQDVQGFDAGSTLPAAVYVLTLQVTAGSAASTVSAVNLLCLAL